MRRLINGIFCLLAVAAVQARDTSTAIFSPSFKSLQVLDPGNRLGTPVIHGGNDASRLTFSFDELAEDSRYLRYRLVHCDSDWQPSAISDIEYANGFNEGEIDSFDLSDRTFAHYVHYSFTLPNEQLQPLLSGNYLVEVFDRDDSSATLLQARFMVSEDIARITTAVTSRTDADYNGRHQQLAVDVDLEGANVDDPFNDLRLVIVQNGRDADRHVVEKPLRTGMKSATYEHQRELIFDGGSEYRRFTIANVRYPGMGVDRIDYDNAGGLYEAMLVEDEPRPSARYQFDSDQNGRYFVDEINASDPDTQADYVVTYFTLKTPDLGQDIFIDGDMTLRRRDESSQMYYDETLGAYIKTMLLKQGMYNYQYVTADGKTAPVEGDHYETANEYLVLLYHCPPSARYHRLIGSGLVHSGR